MTEIIVQSGRSIIVEESFEEIVDDQILEGDSTINVTRIDNEEPVEIELDSYLIKNVKGTPKEVEEK